MNAAKYYDWWNFSGTAVGATTPGEKYRQIARKLSPAGVHVVVVTEFLQQNPAAIDLARWRAGLFEYEPLKFTIEALDAIGASKTATALRNGEGARRPLPTAAEVRRGIAWDDASTTAAMGELRTHIFAMSEAAGLLPADLRDNISSAKQSQNAETRGEIAQLLEAYVAQHQDELAGDAAKHGDPRQSPDFDEQRFHEEQRHQHQRLLDHRQQRNQLPLLQERLTTVRRMLAKEAANSRRLLKECQLLTREYRECAKRRGLLPGMQAWLREVEQLRDQHLDVFQPKATDNEGINQGLAAIGDYEIVYHGDIPGLSWSNPAGIRCDWLHFHLSLSVELNKDASREQVLAGYRELLRSYERIVSKFAALQADLKKYLIEVSGQVSTCEINQVDTAKEEAVLQQVESGQIGLTYYEGRPVEQSAYFHVEWDAEHGVEVQLNDDGQVVRQSMDES
ncbi:MAG TPA: hypothetical protein VJ783_23860 [Pirellulales bacterium]|nr:hypothetical protein [Pirellulales bacterium]